MDFQRSAPIRSNGEGSSLPELVRGARARAVRVQLAEWHPECSAEEIEDAIQTACKRFLEGAEGISAPGEVYTWVRTTAHRILNRETARHTHEFGVERIEVRMADIPDEDAGPMEELIGREDDADLAALVEEVNSALPERQRDILALWAAGEQRPEIAERLGLSRRKIKRELLEIMDEARVALARMAGGGCGYGEPLVLRSVCGLATSTEEDRIRRHLTHCGRCEILSERLIAWREKAGAMLPAPVAEGAQPGVVERAMQGAADRLAAAKEQIFDGGAQLKQHAAAATATHYRPVDPTPLAAARPGTVAAVVASCLTIGGGAAAYCVEKGVDPLAPAKGAIAAVSGEEPSAPPPPEPEAQAPVYTPVEPPATEEPPPAEAPPSEAEEQPKPEPVKASPVPDNFEPTRPPYMAEEEDAEPVASEEAANEPAPIEGSRQPDAVPAGTGPQFGGPGGGP
jgi:RNA polymerase sigma factor (sigma-70 family)